MQLILQYSGMNMESSIQKLNIYVSWGQSSICGLDIGAEKAVCEARVWPFQDTDKYLSIHRCSISLHGHVLLIFLHHWLTRNQTRSKQAHHVGFQDALPKTLCKVFTYHLTFQTLHLLDALTHAIACHMGIPTAPVACSSNWLWSPAPTWTPVICQKEANM